MFSNKFKITITVFVVAVVAALGSSPTRDGTYANYPTTTTELPLTNLATFTARPSGKFTPDPATLTCCKNGNCDGCPKGEVFRLYMPIANTMYDCDLTKPEFANMKQNSVNSKKCGPNCGQQWGTPGTRNITVYVPAVYKDGDEAGVMVSQDGGLNFRAGNGVPQGDSGIGEFKADGVRNTMDNLMGKTGPRSLPTFIWVSIALAGPSNWGNRTDGTARCDDGIGSERFVEYPTTSSDYARFVNDQALPFVLNHPDIKAKFPNMKFTKDPEGRAAAGCSNGGGAALKMGFWNPELFGIVIGYSASLQDYDGQPRSQAAGYPQLSSKKEYPRGLAELWVPAPEGKELIKTLPNKNIRVFHSGNQRDFGTPDGCFKNNDVTQYGGPVIAVFQGDYMDFLVANNKTEAALVAKGYQTRYMYGLDSCHCQEDTIGADFPNTLVWAWAKWNKKAKDGKHGVQEAAKVLIEAGASRTCLPSVTWLLAICTSSLLILIS